MFDLKGAQFTLNTWTETESRRDLPPSLRWWEGAKRPTGWTCAPTRWEGLAHGQLEPPIRVELMTYGLRNRCSTN